MEAKNIVSTLQNIYNESLGLKGGPKSSGSNESTGSRNTIDFTSSRSSCLLSNNNNNGGAILKNIVFKLKNYFLVDAFSEEFIAYDGIRVLINLIEITSGNTRVLFIYIYFNNYFIILLNILFLIYVYFYYIYNKAYAINSFKCLLHYENSYGYIQENKEVVETLYTILVNFDAMNTATHTLEVLILITDILNDFGVNIILRSAELYAMKNSTKIFKELVSFINDSNIDIKLNAITLICFMLEKCSDKVKVNFFNNFFY